MQEEQTVLLSHTAHHHSHFQILTSTQNIFVKYSCHLVVSGDTNDCYAECRAKAIILRKYYSIGSHYRNPVTYYFFLLKDES